MATVPPVASSMRLRMAYPCPSAASSASRIWKSSGLSGRNERASSMVGPPCSDDASVLLTVRHESRWGILRPDQCFQMIVVRSPPGGVTLVGSIDNKLLEGWLDGTASGRVVTVGSYGACV